MMPGQPSYDPSWRFIVDASDDEDTMQRATKDLFFPFVLSRVILQKGFAVKYADWLEPPSIKYPAVVVVKAPSHLNPPTHANRTWILSHLSIISHLSFPPRPTPRNTIPLRQPWTSPLITNINATRLIWHVLSRDDDTSASVWR
jgi:hypothetical protein